MATISIRSIKNNLKVFLDYIMNPVKTINNDYENNKIETFEDLLYFKKQNSIKLQELVSKIANLCRKYKRFKSEDDMVYITILNFCNLR